MSKLGQNFNAAGIGLFVNLLGGDRQLALPHLSVPDIRWVDWAALRLAGMRGVVFDKDNTLTMPFALGLDPKLEHSLQRCREVFEGKVVMYSNSAGLAQYDPKGKEAAELEALLGVHVLRHSEKKPAGGKDELEAYLGCPANQLVMVGDRYLTDIVFGNRHGMLTIRPMPLTLKGEPMSIMLARKIEDSFVRRWTLMGTKPPPHALVPENGSAAKFMFDQPLEPPPLQDRKLVCR